MGDAHVNNGRSVTDVSTRYNVLTISILMYSSRGIWIRKYLDRKDVNNYSLMGPTEFRRLISLIDSKKKTRL